MGLYHMKSEKPKRNNVINIIIGIVFCVEIICLTLNIYLPAKLHLYDTMTGIDGLKNVIVAIILKYVLGLIFSIPIYIIGILFLVNIFRNRKNIKRSIFLLLGVLLLTVAFPLFFYYAQNESRFRIQQHNKNISGLFAEAKVGVSCFSDFMTDDYDEFTVNKCYVEYGKFTTSANRMGGSHHNEYEAWFYYDENLVTRMQIGKSEYDYLSDLIPAKFDTKITVYKKADF